MDREKDVESASSRYTGVYDWIGVAIVSLAAVALIFSFAFRIFGVDGDSMNPTLHTGERLIVSRLPYVPQRGDIVIAALPGQAALVKRVIGLPGERVTIDDETGEVAVDDEVLDEPYIQGTTFSKGLSERIVPEGCVFVMGDNRENSTDSRSARIGFIPVEDLAGKVIYRFYPLNKMGRVTQ